MSERKLVQFGGDKGGTGKSFVSKAAIDYHLDREKPILMFDTDRSNPDVFRTFEDIGCQLAILSEGRKFQDAANPIFNAVMEKTTLVNLPAQVFPALKEWLENNAVIELCQEEGIEFVYVFVTDGEFDSLNLLKKTLRYFGDRVRHLVVKNHGTVKSEDEQTAWAAFERDKDLQDLIADTHATAIDFPAFYGDSELTVIDRESLSFRQALTYKGFGILSRKRVHKFVQQAFAAFDEAGAF